METTQKVYDLLAEKLGWDDFDHMMLNEDHIEDQLKKAINLLCESYRVKIIFK